MELETDVVPHASGSARLRLANTDILVGVKTEIDKPFPLSPNEGKIEFFVDWLVPPESSTTESNCWRKSSWEYMVHGK